MSFEKAAEIGRYLKKFTVGIAGCGGLGSNCAAALARAGVGRLVIADFDIVTIHSLRRQYYFHDQIGRLKVHALKDNLLRINPEIIVKAFDMKLCTSDIVDLFSHCDVIVEAFDKPEMKYMIIETVLTKIPGKPLVAGVGLAGWGNTNLLKSREAGNLVVCGDGVSEVSDIVPALAPRTGIVANMQANEVLNQLLKNYIPEEQEGGQ